VPKEIDFKISYDGGSAAEGLIDIYNAGVSAKGLSRCLAITVHAFANDGQIRTRAERAVGAKIYLSAPRHGSFEEVVKIVFSDSTVNEIGISVIGAAFYDFLKWTWCAALGNFDAKPSTPHVRKLSERQEPFIGEIATVLETPMQELHRPIEGDREIKIYVVRPRIGILVTMDTDTLEYVSTQSEAEKAENVRGNVTKYNILSGFGRFYSDDEGRTISFDLEQDVTSEEKRLLTWSMDQRSLDKDGKIYIDVSEILNARGDLKRYKVSAVRRTVI
jgi:hypothetical protein